MQLWIKKQILTLGPFGHMNHPNHAIRLASTNRSRLGEGHTLPNQLISPLKWIKCSVPHININWWNRLLPEWECAIGMLMKNTFHLSTFDRSKSNRTSFAVFGSPFPLPRKGSAICAVYETSNSFEIRCFSQYKFVRGTTKMHTLHKLEMDAFCAGKLNETRKLLVERFFFYRNHSSIN